MAATAGPKTKWIWLAIAAIAGIVIAVLPGFEGLSHQAQLVLAITVFSAILWAFQVINNGVASVLMMGLLIVAGVRPPLALSGFGSSPFWVLVTVLFYGFAMKKTGLAERLSYYILSLFPCTYSGILSAFFVIGFVLGCAAGAVLEVHCGLWAMALPVGLAAVAVLLGERRTDGRSGSR